MNIKIGQRYRNVNGVFEVLECLSDKKYKLKTVQRFATYVGALEDFTVHENVFSWDLKYLAGQDKPGE